MSEDRNNKTFTDKLELLLKSNEFRDIINNYEDNSEDIFKKELDDIRLKKRKQKLNNFVNDKRKIQNLNKSQEISKNKIKKKKKFKK